MNDGFWLQALVLLVVAAVVWRMRAREPDDATRRQIERALQLKGLTLIDVSTTLRPVGPNRADVAYVARARNPFGNVQKQVFSRNRQMCEDGTVEELPARKPQPR